MAGRRLVPLGLILAAAFVTSGCQYLLGLGMDPTAPFPDDFGSGSMARYPTGTATVTIGGGAPMVLDRVTVPGTYDPSYGAQITLGGPDGWYVQLFDVSTAMPGDENFAFLGLERIVDQQHWTLADPSRCALTVTQADATGLRGTASCRGLRWADALAGGWVGGPHHIEGQDAFDAEITFEASSTAPTTS